MHDKGSYRCAKKYVMLAVEVYQLCNMVCSSFQDNTTFCCWELYTCCQLHPGVFESKYGNFNQMKVDQNQILL